MTEVTLFKNHYPSCQVVTTMGTYPFVAGRFWTEDSEVEKHLKKLAERGEYGMYIDPTEPTIDPAASTPMEALKKKIIAEHMATLRTGGSSGVTESAQASVQASVVTTADSVINGGAQAPLTAEEKIEIQTGAGGTNGTAAEPSQEQPTKEAQQAATTSPAQAALMAKLNERK